MSLATKQQVADHFSVTTTTVDNWAREGMPYQQVGGRRRFDLAAIERWHEARQDARRRRFRRARERVAFAVAPWLR